MHYRVAGYLHILIQGMLCVVKEYAYPITIKGKMAVSGKTCTYFKATNTWIESLLQLWKHVGDSCGGASNILLV